MADSKTLNVYLPEGLYSEIESEASRKGCTKGKIIRERLRQPGEAPTGKLVADLFGVADDLPEDLSTASDDSFRDYGADDHH